MHHGDLSGRRESNPSPRAWKVPRKVPNGEVPRELICGILRPGGDLIGVRLSWDYRPFMTILGALRRGLREQLAAGGRLVQPVGPGGEDLVIAFERRPEGLERKAEVTWAHFVKLYGAHGFRRRVAWSP